MGSVATRFARDDGRERHKFPPGNKFGNRNDVLFRNALLQALSEIHEPSGRTKLEAVAHVLTNAALAGDAWAVKEVVDRVDGKPRNAPEDVEDDNKRIMVTKVEWVVVSGREVEAADLSGVPALPAPSEI